MADTSDDAIHTTEGEQSMTDLDARRAEGIVNALTDQETATCSDCGETIDVSEATDPMSVVIVLEQHRKTHEGINKDE